MQNYTFKEAVGGTVVGAAIVGISALEGWGVSTLATNIISKTAELGTMNIQEAVQVVAIVAGALGGVFGGLVGGMSALHAIAAPFVYLKESRGRARENEIYDRIVYPSRPRRRGR